MTELSNTTAEHRPCWNLLYNCSEIGYTILEKWEKSLSATDIADIKWALKEISLTLEKIKKKSVSDD